MIIWSFEGLDVTFRSTPARHARDVFKMAAATGLDPKTKIIYHHGNPNRNLPEDAIDSNGTTTSDALTSVSVNPKKTRSRKKTTDVSNLHGDVDESIPTPDPVVDPADIHPIGDSDSIGDLPVDGVVDDTNG